MYAAAAGRRSTGRASPGSDVDRMCLLPAEIYVKIFSLVPAREIAKSCALVCRSWRSYSSCGTLWKNLCNGSGFQDVDAMRFTSWRSLFATVYGTNLIGSPHFERVDIIDARRIKSRKFQRWCEPKHYLYPDRLYYENELHDEPHSYCHWNPDRPDGGSVFQRGGGDGIIRECPPVGCSPCPGAPEKPVLATSFDWGKVCQVVDLSQFPTNFLYQSPPLLISVWFAGKRGTLGMFRIEVFLRDEENNIIASRFSGDLMAEPDKWRKAKLVIHGYPKGMQSIFVKFSGMSLGAKSGFHGAKCTAVRMQFLAPAEAELKIKECATWKSARLWQRDPGDRMNWRQI